MKTARSADLRAFFARPEAYATMALDPWIGHSSWEEGGCWLAARAIQRVLGGEVQALVARNDPQHAVVFDPASGTYLDASGEHTRRGLLQKWARQGVRGAELAPLDAADEDTFPPDEPDEWPMHPGAERVVRQLAAQLDSFLAAQAQGLAGHEFGLGPQPKNALPPILSSLPHARVHKAGDAVTAARAARRSLGTGGLGAVPDFSKSMPLPADHRIREYPDDILLYNLIVAEVRAELDRLAQANPRRRRPVVVDHAWLVRAAYALARSHCIPGEIVSKALAVYRKHDGRGLVD